MEDTLVASSMGATNPRWLAPEILQGEGATFASVRGSMGMRTDWLSYL